MLISYNHCGIIGILIMKARWWWVDKCMDWVSMSTYLVLKRNKKWIDVARLDSLVLAYMILVFKLIAHFQDRRLIPWKHINHNIKPIFKSQSFEPKMAYSL